MAQKQANQNITYLHVSTSIGENEILYCPYQDKNEEKMDIDNVIFFGGDVHDFKRNMIKDNSMDEYGDFCLESVSQILRSKFTTSNILIIRPAERNGSFSVFSNFLCNVDHYGQSVPSCKNGTACTHLSEILCDKQLNINPKQCKLHLIGFSRGVNVLNQMVYERDYKLFDRVQSMYFLDGGNGGKPATLPNEDQVIRDFVEVIKDGFQFNIYGTNYQWKDKRRPWIGKEQKYFVESLQALQAQKKKKVFPLHHHLYDDKILNESLLKNNVRGFQTSKIKGIYRHFELLRLFNVNSLKCLV
eukprot:5804_1